MLTENDVVDAVCRYLSRSTAWEVVGRCDTTERGDDIRAQRGARSLRIEAKGGGSSKPGTKRHGKAFTPSQIRDHVAKAVLTALQVTQDGDRAGIALPDDTEHRHRRVIERVGQVLHGLDIVVFWVDDHGRVHHDPCRWLDAAH